MSRTEIDTAGDRLRERIDVTDLRLLDSYRRSYRNEYDLIVGRIREALAIEASGRPAKSTSAIVEKLRRGTMRLSQMQDIAGCRLVVPTIIEQDAIVRGLCELFTATVYDRRQKPSFGYRAVHVVARVDLYPVEVQVRTQLQHLWAELSEKLADVYEPSIKYGGGPTFLQKLLIDYSSVIAKVEALEINDPFEAELLEIKRDIQKGIQDAIATLRRNV